MKNNSFHSVNVYASGYWVITNVTIKKPNLFINLKIYSTRMNSDELMIFIQQMTEAVLETILLNQNQFVTTSDIIYFKTQAFNDQKIGFYIW